MSYIALYRKWRPKTFTDVVGQKQVSLTLMRALREGKLAHAYLFSGPRGTGKTSMAKILARAINCEHGPTDHPCNTCDACLAILQGESMDVIEIDAASNRGIDEVRALREHVKFLPVEGRKKVFIIDEAHMLTMEAWNALLKTIEEPPEHVLFIFATTEYEKLPVTIISRCQRYHFKRIGVHDIAEHLLYVAKQSDIALSEEAAHLIAVEADGGLRDALSMLDQCTGMTDDTITASCVVEMLGLIGKTQILDFYAALVNGDGATILSIIRQYIEEGREVIQLVEAMAEHIRALLLYKVDPSAEELMTYASHQDTFESQAKEASVLVLHSWMQEMQRMSRDSKMVDHPRLVVEMGFLSICAMQKHEEEDVLTRISAIEFSQHRAWNQVTERVSSLEKGYKELEASLEEGRISSVYPVHHPANEVEIEATNQKKTSTKSRIQSPPNVRLGEPKLVKPISTQKNKTTIVPPPPILSEKASTLMTKQVAEDVFIEGEVLSAKEYEPLHKYLVDSLKDAKEALCSSCMKWARLSYVDEAKAIFAFKNEQNIKMLEQMGYIPIVERVLSTMKRRPMRVLAYAADSKVLQAYMRVVKEEEGARHAQSASVAAATPNERDDAMVERVAATKGDVGGVDKKEMMPSASSRVSPAVPPLPEDDVLLDTIEFESVHGSEIGPEEDSFSGLLFMDEDMPIDDFTVATVPEKAVLCDEAHWQEVEETDATLAQAFKELAQNHDVYMEIVNEEDNHV